MKSLILICAFCSFSLTTFAHGEKETEAQHQKLELTELEEIKEDPKTELSSVPSPDEEQRLERFRKLVEEAFQKLRKEL